MNFQQGDLVVSCEDKELPYTFTKGNKKEPRKLQLTWNSVGLVKFSNSVTSKVNFGVKNGDNSTIYFTVRTDSICLKNF